MRYVIISLRNLSDVLKIATMCIAIMSIIDDFRITSKCYVLFILCFLFNLVADCYLLGEKNEDDCRAKMDGERKEE